MCPTAQLSPVAEVVLTAAGNTLEVDPGVCGDADGTGVAIGGGNASFEGLRAVAASWRRKAALRTGKMVAALQCYIMHLGQWPTLWIS